MEKRVQKQRLQWTKEYESIEPKLGLTYDEFVWGCEIARSRAFSSNFIPPFDFKPYAFTCVLVAFTVFGGYGSLEQAANGAAVVVCANLLKDFVIPKIAVSGKNEWGTKRYVIAPGIDLCQHSNSPTAAVAFEYFSNTFSLSTLSSDRSDGSSGGEDAGDGKFNPIEISYGARSNDSLFQYYGFVLEENPHDVYVLPSLRETNIKVLECAAGVAFDSEKLIKLGQSNLLDCDVIIQGNDELDPAIFAALETLCDGDTEATRRCCFALLNDEEKKLPTSLEEDLDSRRANSNDLRDLMLSFRIAKKTKLKKAIALYAGTRQRIK